jgi:hypothetical protein
MNDGYLYYNLDDTIQGLVNLLASCWDSEVVGDSDILAENVRRILTSALGPRPQERLRLDSANRKALSMFTGASTKPWELHRP